MITVERRVDHADKDITFRGTFKFDACPRAGDKVTFGKYSVEVREVVHGLNQGKTKVILKPWWCSSDAFACAAMREAGLWETTN